MCAPIPRVQRPLIKQALVRADAADGSTDQVITRCAGCALHMDGSADHNLEVGGFDLHLCSAACKKRFASDLSVSLASLVDTVAALPQDTGPETAEPNTAKH